MQETQINREVLGHGQEAAMIKKELDKGPELISTHKPSSWKLLLANEKYS